jgi:hypothetical protein
MPLDPDAILPWTCRDDGVELVLSRPIAPPDLIVGALYGGLTAFTAFASLFFAVRAAQFWSDPVGPWVLGGLAAVCLLVAVWAIQALRSDAIREVRIANGRLGLGEGGLLGLRRTRLTGTQIGGLRIVHRHFDEIREGEREDRRWTELYLQFPSMPDRFLGFFAGATPAIRERAATMVAERLGVTPTIEHQEPASSQP